jgi:cation diffusion facilitator family transporter
MHTLSQWQHPHSYGADAHRGAERRTRWVIVLTIVMMVVEIGAGIAFGSIALLADGWHMGTHAAALTITVFAYVYARRNATNARYSFGTGKVSALGGFASAVGLAVVALLVLGECVARLAEPVTIRFDDAIAVAGIGLLVNIASALILRGEHGHGHDEHHGHGTHHHDHNLRGAYLHVLADALTSVLAILALLVGKYAGWVWMDPLMGIVGAVVIGRWSFGLVRETSAVLLDAEISTERRQAIQHAIEAEQDTEVADLHVWRVGPHHLAAIVSVVSHAPREPAHYKSLLRTHPDLVHVTVEVNECRGDECK